MESSPLHRPSAPLATAASDSTKSPTAAAATAATAAAAAAAAAVASQNARRARATTREWSEEEDTRLVEAVKAFGGKNWKGIAALVGTRDFMQCNQRWRKSLRPGLTKGTWTSEEDNQLRSAIHMHGCNSWRAVAELVEGRNTKQCKERWCKYLDPTINMGAWTPAEDLKLMNSYTRHKGRWAHIAADIEGRTDNMVKVRYKSLMRRHLKKNKPKKQPAKRTNPAGEENLAKPPTCNSSGVGKKRGPSCFETLKDASNSAPLKQVKLDTFAKMHAPPHQVPVQQHMQHVQPQYVPVQHSAQMFAPSLAQTQGSFPVHPQQRFVAPSQHVPLGWSVPQQQDFASFQRQQQWMPQPQHPMFVQMPLMQRGFQPNYGAMPQFQQPSQHQHPPMSNNLGQRRQHPEAAQVAAAFMKAMSSHKPVACQ